MFFKFKQNEVIRNRIKFYPYVNFKTYDGNLYLNNQHTNLETSAPYGTIDLYDYAGVLSNTAYAIVPKTSDLYKSNDVTFSTYTSSAYGTEFTQSYPIYSQISSDRIVPNANQEYINSISQIAKLYYRHLNSEVDCDFNSITKTIINIPRMFYGSSIKKGSVICRIRRVGTGETIAEARDEKQNGVLYHTDNFPSSLGSLSGSIAGLVLYSHGIILMTSSLDLADGLGSVIFDGTTAELRWNYFIYTGSMEENDFDTEMELEFRGTEYLNTITMFAHAPTSLINHSNNPTYKIRTSGANLSTASNYFIENPQQGIKNIVYNGISDQTSSFSKEVYIEKIGIYDSDKNLLAITSLANPVRKKQNDGFTFKIKKDLL